MTATVERLPTPSDSRQRWGALVAWNLRERARVVLLVAALLFAVPLMVFALYPAISSSIGALDVPDGIADLLGGADFGTLPGWIGAELVGVLGPASLLALGATLGAGYLAGREESGVAAVLLSTPVTRRTVAAAGIVASALLVTAVAAAQYAGFVVGDALITESLSAGHVLATNVHLLSVGLFGSALSLAVGALTGRRQLALAVAGAVGIGGFLLQGVAGSVEALRWTQNLSVFSWSVGHRPLENGLDLTGLLVLLAATALCWGVALLGGDRRDLRL